jgi:hypothetical protein
MYFWIFAGIMVMVVVILELQTRKDVISKQQVYLDGKLT